nr:MAG TPA: hypothetical protein [Caudoviricetes sp.]
MDKGIWRVARARLCVACLQEMAADYIIEPAFHGWAQGVCPALRKRAENDDSQALHHEQARTGEKRVVG